MIVDLADQTRTGANGRALLSDRSLSITPASVMEDCCGRLTLPSRFSSACAIGLHWDPDFSVLTVERRLRVLNPAWSDASCGEASRRNKSDHKND